MKKYIILFIMYLVTVQGQNTGIPGKDYFPYMSFWDFAVYQNHPRQSRCDASRYESEMSATERLYYYPDLMTLGLTNIVTDYELLLELHVSDYVGAMKFLDMDFSWAGDDEDPFESGRYLKATGNNPDLFPHQLGGDWDMSWSPFNKNYGFGNSSMRSRWAMEPDKQPAGSPPLTGLNRQEEVPPIGLSQVRYQLRGSQQVGGTLFYGNIDAGHFPHPDAPYKLSFFIRGDEEELLNEVDPNAIVLTIYVVAGDALYQKPYNKNIGVEPNNPSEEIETLFLTNGFNVTGAQLMGSPGTYRWITTPEFDIPGEVNITYYAVWTGEASIFCDRMIMFNEFYDRMFNPTGIAEPLPPPDFETEIGGRYSTPDTLLHIVYVDEPPLLTTEAFARINSLVESTLGARNPGMELNGAIGPHAEWGMRFDQYYGKSAFDNKYKRKYLLYNVYPFRQELTVSQTDSLLSTVSDTNAIKSLNKLKVYIEADNNNIPTAQLLASQNTTNAITATDQYHAQTEELTIALRGTTLNRNMKNDVGSITTINKSGITNLMKRHSNKFTIKKEPKPEEVITEYSLSQNYPNPFNSSTIIEYALPKDGLVSIKLYDITGSLVKQLVNEQKPSGRHKTTIESGNLASGIYIYSLRVNDININKKLVILK